MTRTCGFAVSSDGTEIFYVVHPGDSTEQSIAQKPTFLLIHGWSATGAAWGEEFIGYLTAAGYRVVAVDTRGHGLSAVPTTDEPFSTQHLADDIAAVRSQLDLGDVILVGWSYGGLIIADHLSVYGTEGVVGVGLIGAITSIGFADDGTQLPGAITGRSMNRALPAALSNNPVEAIGALAGLRLLPKGFDKDALGSIAQQQFGYALTTAPSVRGGMFRRTVNHDADLVAWTFPVLIQHGRDDGVVDAASAEHHEKVLPNATVSWWDAGGHAPFLVDPRRSAGELLTLVPTEIAR